MYKNSIQNFKNKTLRNRNYHDSGESIRSIKIESIRFYTVKYGGYKNLKNLSVKEIFRFLSSRGGTIKIVSNSVTRNKQDRTTSFDSDLIELRHFVSLGTNMVACHLAANAFFGKNSQQTGKKSNFSNKLMTLN